MVCSLVMRNMGISSLWLWVVMILVLVEGWSCFGCLEQERIALLQLKANINYPNGTSLPSWVDKDTADCCQWEGVECSNTTTNRVTQLSLNHTRRIALRDGYIKNLGDWHFNASLFLPFQELRALHLFDNLLVGWVENEGFENLSRLRNLEVLDLGANRFNNSLLSSLSALSSLKYLDLSNSGLRGSADSNSFGRLTGLSNLEVLDLSGNGLNNSIHSFLKLDDLVSLKELDLGDNHIQSFDPVQGLEGSSVLSNLEALKLSFNYLNNSILPSLRGLSTLKLLDLSLNRLKGSIHVKDLNALCNLKELDLSFNEIESFVNPEGSTNLSNLEILFLDGSSLGKNFLQSVGVLTSLKVLSLPSCDLEGTLPTQGEIPLEFGNLSNIRALNLSHNDFTGSIPTTFSNLRQVESLDLSYNNLNGRIPSQLIELNSLAVFSVAHNNLSGIAPDRKAQFATFEESSYEGNPLLCGPPLHDSCNEIASPLPNASNHQAEEDGFIDMGVFYVSFYASYVTVLFGIAAVLYINPRWRQAWFYLVEICITSSYYFVMDNFPKLPKFRNM